MKRPLDVVAQRPPGEYVMYSHKSVKFARYLRDLSAVHVVSELPADEVSAVHMHPAESAQAVIDGWARRAVDGDRIALVDDASRFAVYPE